MREMARYLRRKFWKESDKIKKNKRAGRKRLKQKGCLSDESCDREEINKRNDERRKKGN